MSEMPMDMLLKNLDRKVAKHEKAEVVAALRDSGYGQSLIDFLAPLYQVADKATFLDGAWRVIPLASDPKRKMLGLAEWNTAPEWKESAPEAAKERIYFLSNSFGDLFGVPVDGNLELRQDCVGVLWVDEYKYEEFGVSWAEILRKVFINEDEMGVFLGRLKDHAWAAGFLGAVKPHESYAWAIPPVVGGAGDIDNLQIGRLGLNVSFTLQLLAQELGKGAAAA